MQWRQAIRLEGLDVARLIAIAAIVFVHSRQSPELDRWGVIGTFGVPFYVFASLYFQARAFNQNPNRPFFAYVVARFRRLYIPFLAWSVVYLVARDLKHLFIAGVPSVPIKVWQLWAGTSLQLWFLPLLLYAGLVGALLLQFFGTDPRARTVVIVVTAICGWFLATAPRPDWLNYVNQEEGVFFLQCWRALPSVCWGLSLGWLLGFRRNEYLITPLVATSGILLLAGTVGDQLAHGYSRLYRTLSGLGLLLASLGPWHGPAVSAAARLGRLSYGVYLAHSLLIEGLQSIANRFGVPHELWFDVATFAFGLGGSLALTWLLARSRRTAWLIGDFR
ncbi:MAG: acyltransferase family protein [Tepidisphaeraceae bacterium]